ncbi:putative ribonuclease H-like domain-containing protein [Tanacetum coccineum]
MKKTTGQLVSVWCIEALCVKGRGHRDHGIAKMALLVCEVGLEGKVMGLFWGAGVEVRVTGMMNSSGGKRFCLWITGLGTGYVVPTGRVVVPTGRYVVPAGKVIIIVSPGRLSLVPTGRVLSPGPNHSAFVSTTSASKKMSYADSPSYSHLPNYNAPSNSKTKGLTDWFNKKKVRCYKCLQRGHFARECRAKGGNDKQRYSSFKIQEIGKKEEDSKALITVDTLVDWTEHEDHIDLDESQMSYGTKSSTSGDSNSVSNDFVSCDNSDKSSELYSNTEREAEIIQCWDSLSKTHYCSDLPSFLLNWQVNIPPARHTTSSYRKAKVAKSPFRLVCKDMHYPVLLLRGYSPSVTSVGGKMMGSMKWYVLEYEHVTRERLDDYQEFQGGKVTLEFKNAHIIELCGSNGIKGDYSNARIPQQNGFAERKNRTLIEAARTMLADSKLPTKFVGLKQTFPSVSHFKPFGCHVTILNTSDHLVKFDGKDDEGYIVGYSASNKSYRVYNVPNKRVEETMNMRYLEEKPNVYRAYGHDESSIQEAEPKDTSGDEADDSPLDSAEEIFQ